MPSGACWYLRAAPAIFGVRLLLGLVILGGLVLKPLADTAAAAPLHQNFACGDAGVPTPAGRFSCWNWTTPAGHAPPGGEVRWVHDCGPGGIVIAYWYHWEGSPFQVTGHEVGPEEHQLTVTAVNAGRAEGAFWVTGRCRSV